MRDGFDAVYESGASLACMGANTCYWQARFEDAERTMVEHRRSVDPSQSLTEDGAVSRPRSSAARVLVMGVQYQDGMTGREPPRDYELSRARVGDPWLEGTGFELPATLRGLVGYEWDALQEGANPKATVFFHYENEVSTRMSSATRPRREGWSSRPAHSSSAGASTTGGTATRMRGCSGS